MAIMMRGGQMAKILNLPVYLAFQRCSVNTVGTQLQTTTPSNMTYNVIGRQKCTQLSVFSTHDNFAQLE